MKATLRLTAATTAILATFVLCTTLQADVIDKLENADALNLGTSWDGGVVPDANDIARWPLATSANMANDIGAPWTVGGIVVSNGNGSTSYDSKSVTINGSDTLTLGQGGVVFIGKKGLTVNPPISVAADQTWCCQGGGNLIVASSVALNGHTITLDGSNNKQVKGQFSGSGTFLGKLGQLKMSNGSAASDADLVLYRNSSVSFDTTPATDGACRFHDITLVGTGNGDGASVSGTGPTKSSGHDKISGTLSAEAGNGTIHLSPNSSHHLAFEASNVNIGEAGFLHFRGSNLGLHPAADHVPNSSSILFETSPSLVGGDGGMGSVTQPILPATVISTNNGDFGYTLATYDSTYGIRPLDPDTEYATALPLGQNTFENVRLVNDGTTGTPLQTLLPDGLTAINSLMLDVGGANGDGGYILDAATDATPTLRVNSGVVYVRNMKAQPRTTGDEIPFQNFTLDLNGHRGVFVTRQADQNNMTSKALELRCPIINDGGEGVNFASVQGRGFVYLYGTATNSYTGPTRLLNGYLKLMKANNVQNVCIPGDLELYSGTCQNTGNTIPDTSDIRIYGGSLLQKGGASNSGSGTSETFRDLIMHGGSCGLGASGTSSGGTTMRNATLFAGTMTQTRGHRLTMTGTLTLAGGNLIVNRFESASNRALQFLQGGISITNTPSGAYAPMTFDAGSSTAAPGAKSTLSVGITFVGNAMNDNTTVINAATPGEGIDWAQFLMNGALVFDIGDGVADIDLRIEPQLLDNGETVGSLVKRGAGTLALVNPGNAYTGGTTIESGILIADGALAGDLSVASGATFQAGGIGDTGKVALGGDLTLANGARLRVRHDGTISTCGTVAGAVTSSGTTYVSIEGADKAALKAGIKFLEASSFIGGFTCTDPKVAVVKRNNGTELWLHAQQHTVIMLK
jgi:autotransporter-associated beta strand protein